MRVARERRPRVAVELTRAACAAAHTWLAAAATGLDGAGFGDGESNGSNGAVDRDDRTGVGRDDSRGDVANPRGARDERDSGGDQWGQRDRERRGALGERGGGAAASDVGAAAMRCVPLTSIGRCLMATQQSLSVRLPNSACRPHWSWTETLTGSTPAVRSHTPLLLDMDATDVDATAVLLERRGKRVKDRPVVA